MHKRFHFILGALIVLTALAVGVGCSAAATPAAEQTPAAASGDPAATGRAMAWLIATHQNDDGGYASFSTGAGDAPSDVAGTLDALLALALGEGDTAEPMTYLEANAGAVNTLVAEGGGPAAKAVLGLAAAGANPADFAGHDLAAQLAGHLAESGAYGVEDAYNQALAMLATAATGEAVPDSAASWLVGKQAANGSWDDGFGTVDNPDATAVAIMALLAAGRPADDPAIVAATEFLAGAQAGEGGWGYGAGLPASGNSTALVVQALNALGEDVAAADGRWTKDGRSPLATLLAFQGQSGAFQADFGDGPLDDFFTTVQAIPAAAGRSLVLAPVMAQVEP